MASTDKPAESQGWFEFGEDFTRPPDRRGQGRRRRRTTGEETPCNEIFRDEAYAFNTEILRSLLMSTGEGIYGLDRDGLCMFCNPAAVRLLGFEDAAELVGKPILELIRLRHDDGSSETARDCRILQGMRERRGIHVEDGVFCRQDGQPISVEYRSQPVFRKGDVVGAVVSFTDIAGRKSAEEAMRASEERFRSIFEQTSVGMAIFDTEGRYFAVNRAFREMLGYSEEELLRLKYDDITFEEDREASRERNRRVHAGSLDRFEVEKRYVRKDGSAIWVALSGSTIRNVEGIPVFNIRQIQDITQRKQAVEAVRESEARFRAVIDNSPAAICLRSIDGRYMLFNREFEKRHGMRLEDAKGKHADELEQPEIARMISLNDEIVVETGAPCEYEVEFPDRHNVMRTGFTNKFPIFGSMGEVVGIGSFCADMTDHKQMEEKLRHAQKLEAVGQLTGGVAHDFNNILAVILTNLEFLEEDLAANESHREIISEAIRAVHRGAKLTERLLAFSRKQPLNPKTLDLVGVLSDMVELLRRTLGETIAVQTAFPGDLRPVFVDRNQFENAILNLAVNARDAMKERGGKLEILCTNRKIIHRASGRINEMPSGQYVCVEIRDNGAGMTPEVMERAFEPFFTTKKTGEGSGLGLSMVYGFANQSGGAVTISSIVGEGTSVKLFLPAIPLDKATGTPEPEGIDDAGAATLPRGSESILVVEDDADVGSSAQRTLTSLGYRVLWASEARNALEILRGDQRIDLLFSDVIMPGGIDGRELAEQAKNLVPDLKIILTSGYAAGRLNLFELDAAGIVFVPKPYTRRTLAEAVRATLKGGGGIT
ncbi:MAG: PAS domain S-box protein [Rhodospirillales bacterium]|jgi:PAS domain S-box-containing protein|nr:PAS domain S-box protein [Rhodospirillales bacterium]